MDKGLSLSGNFLDNISEVSAQIISDIYHALIVDGCVADLRDYVPRLQRIRGPWMRVGAQ